MKSNVTAMPRKAQERAQSFSTVSMDAVPDPPVASRKSALGPVIEAVFRAQSGQAVRVPVSSLQRGIYIRGQLRAQAKRRGRFLSSSREADGLTFYFWLEPKEKQGK